VATLPTGATGPTGPTGAAPADPIRTRQAEHGEEWPKRFRYLEYVEFWLVILLAAFLVGLAAYLTVWVLFGCGSRIHSRLVETIRGMNTGWKVCLLILVPLFFRPVYKFMHYLREGPFRTTSTPLIVPEHKSDDYVK
jgi:hypothetical protein